MKTKVILFLMTITLSLVTFSLKADNPPKVKIPLEKITTSVGSNRSSTTNSIVCCYQHTRPGIQTTVYDNLGEITIEVLNTTTGETFYETFNSTLTPQHVLPISGSAGFYTITYTTSGGDEYIGTYMLTD